MEISRGRINRRIKSLRFKFIAYGVFNLDNVGVEVEVVSVLNGEFVTVKGVNSSEDLTWVVVVNESVNDSGFLVLENVAGGELSAVGVHKSVDVFLSEGWWEVGEEEGVASQRGWSSWLRNEGTDFDVGATALSAIVSVDEGICFLLRRELDKSVAKRVAVSVEADNCGVDLSGGGSQLGEVSGSNSPVEVVDEDNPGLWGLDLFDRGLLVHRDLLDWNLLLLKVLSSTHGDKYILIIKIFSSLSYLNATSYWYVGPAFCFFSAHFQVLLSSI